MIPQPEKPSEPDAAPLSPLPSSLPITRGGGRDGWVAQPNVSGGLTRQPPRPNDLGVVAMANVAPGGRPMPDGAGKSVMPVEAPQDVPAEVQGGGRKPPTGGDTTAPHAAADGPGEGGGKPSPADKSDAPLGEPTRRAETTDVGSYSLPPGLELVRLTNEDVILNRQHPQQSLVEAALAEVQSGGRWTPAGGSADGATSYFQNSLHSPTLVARVTEHPVADDRTGLAGIAELEAAPQVRAVVDSPAAQEAVRFRGYPGITSDESLAVVNDHTSNSQAVIFPYDSGQTVAGAEGSAMPYSGAGPLTELDGMAAVVGDMRVLFANEGINAVGLDPSKITIQGDGSLKLHGAKEYQPLDTQPPALQEGEVAEFRSNRWQPRLSSDYPHGEPRPYDEVSPGNAVIARAVSELETSPMLLAKNNTGCVIVAWNVNTQESAMVQAPNAAQGLDNLLAVFSRVPNLGKPGTILNICGPPEAIRPEPGNLVLDLTLAGATATLVQTMPTYRPTDVYLDTHTGTVLTYDAETRQQLYKYTPPGD